MNVTSQNYVANFGNLNVAQGTYINNTVQPYIIINGITYTFGGAPFGDIGSPVADIPTGSFLGGQGGTARLSAFQDGTSNTMINSEILVGISGTSLDLRGFSWWAYSASYTGFLTPNSSQPDLMQSTGYCNYPYSGNPPCAGATTNTGIMLAARSRHPGGVNSAFADGSVHFIKNSVNPYVYRSLSTTKGGEVISADAY